LLKDPLQIFLMDLALPLQEDHPRGRTRDHDRKDPILHPRLPDCLLHLVGNEAKFGFAGAGNIVIS
jgi:hypothetical protein